MANALRRTERYAGAFMESLYFHEWRPLMVAA